MKNIRFNMLLGICSCPKTDIEKSNIQTKNTLFFILYKIKIEVTYQYTLSNQLREYTENRFNN